MQFTGEASFDAMVREWGTAFMTLSTYDPTRELFGIDTLNGVAVVRFNEWVIKGIRGEFYPCQSDIFHASYEPVEMDAAFQLIKS